MVAKLLNGAKKSIGEARANGHRGVIDNQWLMTIIIGVMLTVIGFLAREGYVDIRNDIKEVHETTKQNCLDIAVMKERISHVGANCDALKKKGE
jgi:hypothetical protein